ncbi:MAG: ParB/RepB/Spo0J family partition protein [Planctomycetota bacterium]|jgi:ParB family chromosome partitioning protein
MRISKIRLMKDRRYKEIPINIIKVMNSRNRNFQRFQENIRSIKDVGLKRPIQVNERYYKKNGYYDLICGEGRYLAYKNLKQTKIPAEILNCSKKEAYLLSLIENIARVRPGTMWFAYEVKRMHDSGFTFKQISNITGKGEIYIRDYIRLVEQGEERLVRGVEEGIFSITFAKNVAKSDSSNIQNVLMDAYDKGIVNSTNFPTVKNIIDLRLNRGKGPRKTGNGAKGLSSGYSVQQLKSDITKITKEKEAFVRESSTKENRLLTLLDGLNTLWRDKSTAELITTEGIGPVPKLKGTYNV